MGKILHFTDLIAWQEGHKVVLEIYSITKQLPPEEKYGLSSQLQRAGVSITSNIAEGFGRKGEKEKIQFYYIAHGSLTEVQNLLIILKDLHFITEEKYLKLEESLVTTTRLILGLIKSIRTP